MHSGNLKIPENEGKIDDLIVSTKFRTKLAARPAYWERSYFVRFSVSEISKWAGPHCFFIFKEIFKTYLAHPFYKHLSFFFNWVFCVCDWVKLCSEGLKSDDSPFVIGTAGGLFSPDGWLNDWIGGLYVEKRFQCIRRYLQIYFWEIL